MTVTWSALLVFVMLLACSIDWAVLQEATPKPTIVDIQPLLYLIFGQSSLVQSFQYVTLLIWLQIVHNPMDKDHWICFAKVKLKLFYTIVNLNRYISWPILTLTLDQNDFGYFWNWLC